jgi:hypothetical protein
VRENAGPRNRPDERLSDASWAALFASQIATDEMLCIVYKSSVWARRADEATRASGDKTASVEHEDGILFIWLKHTHPFCAAGEPVLLMTSTPCQVNK